MLSPDDARKISLIEVLLEEAAEVYPDGRIGPPPEQEVLEWSEERIRQYFREQLAVAAQPTAAQNTAANEPTTASSSPAAAAPPELPNGANGAPTGGSASASAPTPPAQTPGLPAASPAWAPCDASAFARWFPGLALSRTATQRPRMRVLAFHSAGSAEDMWTSEGTGARRSPSPLLEWCRATGVELLAVQLPGRGARSKEPFITTAQGIAQELLPVVAASLASGVPYVMLSHSFGCWVGFELLRAAERAGLPMPRSWCLSAMPHPDIPLATRPWRPQRGLGDADFKDEMRGWDVNEVVFTPGVWELYEPVLRADNTVFDEYNLQRADVGGVRVPNGPVDVPPFEFPISAFWGTQDRPVAGNHLWPINNKEAKADWLKEVVGVFDGL
ncbi:Linear gramicidin dehydrogenase LgrE [Tetrabaena socialis]|uniref:Linear gramicidin dehydrogenase LgrE n=1 Tax=Tetrabaena socialis TaxID=47790 RepID=A0A2J8ACT3_9CHLO|nr:Linear gramicidin dehydrogenase LgrE [Tetrabaena socialis]|eukprot:PNH10334.1 Linear gramicidin dehydrogenase LgrE [Tetrabaena socialis]